jgi:hypothetical protein
MNAIFSVALRKCPARVWQWKLPSRVLCTLSQVLCWQAQVPFITHQQSFVIGELPIDGDCLINAPREHCHSSPSNTYRHCNGGRCRPA